MPVCPIWMSARKGVLGTHMQQFEPVHEFTNLWHCIEALDLCLHQVVIARSESSKRRSNPLNRAAQGDVGQGLG